MNNQVDQAGIVELITPLILSNGPIEMTRIQSQSDH